jgi:hypothetical protein
MVEIDLLRAVALKPVVIVSSGCSLALCGPGPAVKAGRRSCARCRVRLASTSGPKRANGEVRRETPRVGDGGGWGLMRSIATCLIGLVERGVGPAISADHTQVASDAPALLESASPLTGRL